MRERAATPVNRAAGSAQPSSLLQHPLVRMFSRRWIVATLLVVIGVAVMARLGIWQLDRLEARRAFNARVQAQLDQPLLVLDSQAVGLDLTGMEYRSVSVRGVYQPADQVALRNQAWENQVGVHLLTPLRIEGTDEYVLVNRGWVPAESGLDYSHADWSAYDEPGVVEVRGMIRASESKPDYGSRADAIPARGEPPLRAWHFANVSAIQQQVEITLLPVYIQQAPAQNEQNLPYRTQPELELTEGPHMGYALQWFGFAALLGLGYPFYIRRREQSSMQESSEIR